MPNKKITLKVNSHDKMFKSVLSKMEEAIEFSIQTMPEKLFKKFDYNSLTLSKDGFVNAALKEYFTDIVYTCNYRINENTSKKIKISLIFEHKSYPEAFPHLQLLIYMTQAWKKQLAKKPQKLESIIPIIFCNGEKEWKFEPFEEYFTDVGNLILDVIPKFNYYLVDTNNYENDQIFNQFKDTPLKLYFLLAKNIVNPKKILPLLKEIFDIHITFDNEMCRKDFYQFLITYLLTANSPHFKAKLEEIMETATYA